MWGKCNCLTCAVLILWSHTVYNTQVPSSPAPHFEQSEIKHVGQDFWEKNIILLSHPERQGVCLCHLYTPVLMYQVLRKVPEPFPESPPRADPPAAAPPPISFVLYNGYDSVFLLHAFKARGGNIRSLLAWNSAVIPRSGDTDGSRILQRDLTATRGRCWKHEWAVESHRASVRGSALGLCYPESSP